MDSDPFPLLEKSHALRRDQIHGQPQEKRFDFRHAPLGTKILKLMDGNAQETVRAPFRLEKAGFDGHTVHYQSPPSAHTSRTSSARRRAACQKLISLRSHPIEASRKVRRVGVVKSLLKWRTSQRAPVVPQCYPGL